MPLSKSTNIVIFWSAPWCSRCDNFYNTEVISFKNEGLCLQISNSTAMNDEDNLILSTPAFLGKREKNKIPLQFSMLYGKTKIITLANSNERIINNKAELLQLHYDFGYLLFSKLQIMVKQGITLGKLVKYKIPTYSVCKLE